MKQHSEILFQQITGISHINDIIYNNMYLYNIIIYVHKYKYLFYNLKMPDFY